MMPCIPLRGLIAFPGTILHFDIGREKSVKALEAAMSGDKLLFLSAQKDENILIPQVKDFYEIGTVVRVKQMLKIQGDGVRVLVDGLYRAKISSVITVDPYFMVETEELKDVPADPAEPETQALMRLAQYSFDEYADLAEIKQDIPDMVNNIKDPGVFCDTIALNLNVKIEEKQNILEALDQKERLGVLNRIIAQENEILRLEIDLNEKVQDSIKKNQKEYFLHEQMKAIQDELGFGEEAQAEASRWLEALNKIDLEDKYKEKVRLEISKFTKMGQNSADAAVIRNYIETIIGLPWSKSSKTNSDLKKAENILNEDHYGLEKVKERILENLAVQHLTKENKGPIICLVGPPGVGKTSIARSIARATGREFVRMSLGGVRDEAEIRGHRRTYIGAIPGRVINNIVEAGTNNPLFLFDEVDKIGSDFRGDPASALLEVLDPEQNSTFTDHYLEVPFDLSKVMFITTANTTSTIPRPLLDRMEVIELSSYTAEEKVRIAMDYLVPKKMKENGIRRSQLSISEAAVRDIIEYYTREAGVRNLEREIGNACRKTARNIVSGKQRKNTITPRNLSKYIGKRVFLEDIGSLEPEVGVTTGLAWTSVGGVTLTIETVKMPGTGRLVLTGQLGDVMKESAQTALGYIKSIASTYKISKDIFKDYDIQIHIPEGATPKDGPSAGITMCSALFSLLTDRKADKRVAMTGEITLRGNVLRIGGLKEKALAAYRQGIRKIIIPKENVPDLEDIPASVRKHIEFIPVENFEEVIPVVIK